jgi:hypothetical protein
MMKYIAHHITRRDTWNAHWIPTFCVNACGMKHAMAKVEKILRDHWKVNPAAYDYTVSTPAAYTRDNLRPIPIDKLETRKVR